MNRARQIQVNLISFGLLAIIILGTSLLTESRQEVRQRLGLLSPTPYISPIPSGQFSLPDPGLLPGHPLYLIKMAGDRFRLLLHSDPQSRCYLTLQYANTRLAAALQLIANGKTETGMTTLFKAEAYLGQAVSLSHPANLQVKQAVIQHQAIIKELKSKCSGKQQEQLVMLERNIATYHP